MERLRRRAGRRAARRCARSAAAQASRTPDHARSSLVARGGGRGARRRDHRGRDASPRATACASCCASRDHRGFYGLRGGGIGWGLPAALGVKLAQPERPVVALVGDGSAMYTIQSLWTAAHDSIAVVFVIFNNASYRILKQRTPGAEGLLGRGRPLRRHGPREAAPRLRGPREVAGRAGRDWWRRRPTSAPAIQRGLASRRPVPGRRPHRRHPPRLAGRREGASGCRSRASAAAPLRRPADVEVSFPQCALRTAGARYTVDCAGPPASAVRGAFGDPERSRR